MPAAFFVVLHIPAHTASELDKVLGRVTPMPVRMPVNGDAYEAGTVYVASSDRHLMFDENVLRVTRGPKEGRVRPSVDVLFRSAAAMFGSRVIGVVMTGTLDDGTAGLWAIKDRNGYAMVQAPSEAAFDSMPRSAIEHVEVDFVGDIAALAQHICDVVGTPASPHPEQRGCRHQVENVIAAEGNGLKAGVMELGKVSKYTCPDCHGVLVQIEEGSIVRFRCHTGHAFSLKTLIAEVNESIDNGLWDTLRAIEERVMLLRQIADLAELAGNHQEAQYSRDQANDAATRLKPLHDLVMDPSFFGHGPGKGR